VNENIFALFKIPIEEGKSPEESVGGGNTEEDPKGQFRLKVCFSHKMNGYTDNASQH